MLLLMLSTAQAAPSGLGIPGVGGGLAGPTEAGAPGLFSSPASAWAVRPELLVDLAGFGTVLTTELEGLDPLRESSVQPLPALALAVPVGPFGLGLAASVPYARSGDGDPEGPLRFHKVAGQVRVYELDLCAAWHALPRLSLGLAGHVAALRLDTTRAVDTGATIAGLTGDEGLGGDPFLEGSQALSGSHGLGLGWGAGLRWQSEGDWVLAGWYSSQLSGTVSADLDYVPISDFDVRITGGVETPVDYPASAGLAAEIPAGAWVLVPQGSWIGWSSWSRLYTSTHDLTIRSQDELLDSLLVGMGVTLDQLLSTMDETVTSTRMHDVFTGGLGLRYQASPGVQLRLGGQYSPAAVPDEVVHPANLDFDILDLGLGAVFSPSRRTRLALTGDVFLAGTRTISGSELSLDNPASSGEVYPSGDGRYALSGGRLGLSWQRRLSPR